MFLHFIVGDIKNQSKGMKPTKNKKKEDKDMAAMPSGEIKGEEDKEDDGTEMAYDDGPAENLMEKGKKIALDDFQMMKVIGRGSFGKVYLVKHKE